ncbi:MAG: type II secretion system secretin GspD [Pseudomonadota bacterium]
MKTPNLHCTTSWIATLTLVVACLLLPTTLLAQQGGITPNYREADIREVIEAVQAVTGKTFIVDARVNAKVTLLASEPMSNEEFYAAFLSILRVNSFQAIESGGVIKIIPDAQTRTYATPPNAREPDAVTTTVLRLENINAAQLVPVMRPLMSTSAHLAAVQSSNALIVSDNYGNVQRIRYLIRQIDRPVESDVEVIRLTNASATELVTTLNALNSATRGDAGAVTGGGPSVVADARTNSVLVSGTTAARVKIRALIAHLDTPLQQGGDTMVRFLNYASAEDLATKLTAQIQQENQGQQQAPGTQPELNIWADERMNALVITGPQAEIRRVSSIIDQLDVRRAQVLVEALIVEVTLTQDSNLGVAVAATDETGDNPLFVSEPSASRPLSTAAGLIGTNDATAIASLISQGLTLGVGRIVDDGISFAAVLNALQSDSNTNVISTPTLVTLDNEEASITIGSEVPFATGQFTNTGGNNNGAVNPFQTIQRESVGTVLTITPQINEGDAILLKVFQEVSSLSSDSVADQPITNERKIETSVIVEDGGILVLGGLIDDQVTESEQRVPILGSIPGIGRLFRSNSQSTTKTNLMVFIKPRIIRDGIGARNATSEKYQYLRDLQLGSEDNPLLLPNIEDQLRDPSPTRPQRPGNIMNDGQGTE